MAVLSISYDLYKEPGRAYEELIKAIQASSSAWTHALESTWYVDTSLTPEKMLAHLKPHLHARDKVVITPVAINKGWWSQGLSEEMLEWFRSELSPKAAV